MGTSAGTDRPQTGPNPADSETPAARRERLTREARERRNRNREVTRRPDARIRKLAELIAALEGEPALRRETVLGGYLRAAIAIPFRGAALRLCWTEAEESAALRGIVPVHRCHRPDVRAAIDERESASPRADRTGALETARRAALLLAEAEITPGTSVGQAAREVRSIAARHLMEDLFGPSWRRKRPGSRGQPPRETPIEDDFTGAADDPTTRLYLEELLGQTSPTDRAVLELHHQGFAHDEIAQLLDLPSAGASRMRLSRARADLRKAAM